MPLIMGYYITWWLLTSQVTLNKNITTRKIKCDWACENRTCGCKLHLVFQKVISRYWNRIFLFCNCFIMPNKFIISAENFITIACWDKKVWVQKDWKSWLKSGAHMLCFCKPGHKCKTSNIVKYACLDAIQFPLPPHKHKHNKFSFYVLVYRT